MEFITKNKTIYELIFRQENIFTDIFYVGIAVITLAIFSNLQIPLWPVPITMQTFGIFLIAFFFGSRKGFLTILAYILVGISGFGIFASYKSGLSAILGPTGGYIIGFLAAVYVVGYLIERGHGRTKKSIFLCLIIGNIIIYFIGLIGLWNYFPAEGFITILKWGLFPFLIGDLVKIGAAMALFPLLWKAGEKVASN